MRRRARLCANCRSELSRYADKVDVDPARLAELEERLNLHPFAQAQIRRDAGRSHRVRRRGEAETGSRSKPATRELARLNAALEKLDAEILSAGKKLSAARKKVIPQLAKAVSKQLEDLGFKQSKFDVAISRGRVVAPRRQDGAARQSLPQSGFDEIEFQFAPNPGEPAKPLRAIASSGEMARVMLALKTVLAAEDEIPVLIFDEVDANVGGETANAVGEKMKQIAAKRQVLCITHLPQVAAPADAHYVVTKQVKNGRTISEITLLDKKSRVTELARMLGGQSDAARQTRRGAFEMIDCGKPLITHLD